MIREDWTLRTLIGEHMSQDTEAHAECYPCRPLPPTDNNVADAKADEGACRRAEIKQTGDNRKEINKHVEEKQGQ
jgi:hypothetical protein